VLQKTSQFTKQRSVIDGQQRLATFTILLKVLLSLSQDYWPKKSPRLPKPKTPPFTNLLWNPQKHPRFTASLNDGDSFTSLLKDLAGLKSQPYGQVKNCYDYFMYEVIQYVENTAGGTKPVRFQKVVNAILDRMFIVEIELSSADDAQGIFQTINYAGVPLTAADLARNFILGLAKKPEDQKRFNDDYWQPLELLI